MMIDEKEIMKSWEINQNVPLVSVKCLAYNHEKYIAECLEGILAQKTTFPFEIIIHDDCSNDNTVEIIRAYQNRYPHIVKPIYEKENQYSKHDGSLDKAILPHLKGKYVAFCECDDVWIDSNKLQSQVEILERDNECVLVLSDGWKGSNLKSKYNKIINPYGINCNGYLDIETIFISKYDLVPTCSMVVRAENYLSMPSFCEKSPVGDKPIRMWCAISGSVYYIARPMVFYRINSGPDSFGQKAMDGEYARSIYTRFCEFLNDFDKYTNGVYSELVNFLKDKEEYIYLGRIKNYKKMVYCNYLKSEYINFSFGFRLKLVFKAYVPWLYLLLKRKNG